MIRRLSEIEGRNFVRNLIKRSRRDPATAAAEFLFVLRRRR